MKYDYDLIAHYLKVDRDTFNREIKDKAFGVLNNETKSQVYTGGLLALTNICVNNCHYCGLNRENGTINRFTLGGDQVKSSMKIVKEMGLRRILLIGGENPKISLNSYLKYIEEAKKNDLEINLAMGVFSKKEYKILKEAGLDYYTIKFEISNPEIFNSCNPDITFEERMKAIYEVKEVGLKLGTG